MMVPKGIDSLTCQRTGPFKVLKQLSTTTYLIDVERKGLQFSWVKCAYTVSS